MEVRVDRRHGGRRSTRRARAQHVERLPLRAWGKARQLGPRRAALGRGERLDDAARGPRNVDQIEREHRAERDAYLEELAKVKIERDGQARRIHLAMDAHDTAERRILWLNQEIQRLNGRVGLPTQS